MEGSMEEYNGNCGDTLSKSRSWVCFLEMAFCFFFHVQSGKLVGIAQAQCVHSGGSD